MVPSQVVIAVRLISGHFVIYFLKDIRRSLECILLPDKPGRYLTRDKPL